jgi:putative nucleotidyltransferase with HDIG domain
VIHFEDFWNHSVACGLIARALADRFGNTDPAEAFVAGLLHDIGVLVMENPPDAAQPWKHAEAGSRLALGWGLADVIAGAIQWHHHPERAGEAWELAATVHVADILSNKLHPCHLDQDTAAEPCDEAMHSFGFYQPLTESIAREFAAGLDLHHANAPSFEQLVLTIRLSLEEAGSLVGLDVHTTTERLHSALAQLREGIFQDISNAGPAL